MKYFQNINTPYVAPVDLETLGRTYTALETMHQEAVKGSSELKQAIANLELNEAEDGFRNQLFLDVERTIDENTRFGNLAAAYDDIVKLSGDIVANPALIGRLRAQKDYKAFQDQVDAMQMPDNYKDYFKEKNPYYYQDIKDEYGRIIKGSKWNPSVNPTKILDYNDVIKQALNYFTPSQSKSQTLRYMKEDGSFTTKMEPGTKAVWYDTITTQVTEIKEQELKDAIEAAIRANPAILASIEQDRQVAMHDMKKGNDPLYKVHNGTSYLTLNQFKDEIFKPFIDAKKEKIVFTERDQNKNFYKEYAAMFGSGDEDTPKDPYSADTIIGPLVEFSDYSTVQTINNIKEGNQKLKTRFYQMTGVDAPIDINDENSYYSAMSDLSIFRDIPKDIFTDREEVVKYVTENKIDKGVEIINTYDKLLKEFEDYQIIYGEDVYNNKKILEQDPESKSLAAAKFKADVLNGETWDETSEDYIEPINKFENRLRNSWKDIINKYFPEDAVSLNVEFIQQKAYDNFVKTIGADNIITYGIKTSHNGNKTVVSLPKENIKYLEQFKKGIRGAEDSLNFWQREGKLYTIDSNGNKSSILLQTPQTGPGRVGNTRPAQPTDLINAIEGVLSRAEDMTNNGIGQSKYIETFILPGGTTSSTEAQYAIKALDVANPDDMKRLSALKSASEVNNEYILDNIRLSGETNCKIRIIDSKNNVLRKATGKEAIDFKNKLFNSDNVGEPGIIFLPDEMKYVPYITFINGDGELNYMAYDFGNNHRITKDLNNDVYLRSRAELMLSHGQQKSIKIAGTDNGGKYSPIFLTPTIDGGFDIGDFDGKYDTENYADFHIYPNDPSFNSAIELKTLTEQLNYIKSNDIQLTNEGKINLLNAYVKLMSDVVKIPINELSDKKKRDIIIGFSAESGIELNITE